MNGGGGGARNIPKLSQGTEMIVNEILLDVFFFYRP